MPAANELPAGIKDLAYRGGFELSHDRWESDLRELIRRLGLDVILGQMYEHGRGGLPKDDREAVRLYKLAADQGNAIGQTTLGVFYESGRGGLPKDDREAARLYKLAADQGNAAAQAYLGILYEQGRGGLPQDDRKALRLYKLAADQGNVYAQAGIKRLAP